MYNYPQMVPNDSGFEELSHTADLAVRVWATSLPTLFIAAARGMYVLSGVKPSSGPRLTRLFSVEAIDNENLLVLFLSELVYVAE